MSYTVRIRNNETGEIRSCRMDFDWFKTDPSGYKYDDHFWWTDGNFGCDCNRFLQFEYAAGKKPDEVMNLAECSTGKYTAIDATLPDGAIIPIDVAP